jgi:hypothetical protein
MVGPEEQQHNEVGRTVGRFEGQDVSSWAIYVTFNATLSVRLVAIRPNSTLGVESHICMHVHGFFGSPLYDTARTASSAAQVRRVFLHTIQTNILIMVLSMCLHEVPQACPRRLHTE